MARGNLVTRAKNLIFRANPEDTYTTSRDTDLETLGYSSPPTDIDMRQYTTYREDRSPWDWYAEQLAKEATRKKKYAIFHEMDSDSPELSSALDIYADNSVQTEEGQPILTINAKEEKVTKILDDFVKRVGLNEKIWTIARHLAKYGESFEEVVVGKDLKIARIKNLPGRSMVRNEDEFGRLKDKAFLQKSEKTDKIIAPFQKWQVVHFRIQKNRSDLYGSSILDPAIKVYKQLSMMEDSMVIARLTRAQQRLAFLVDVEGKTDDDALDHMERVKNRMKKRKTINPRTGRQDLNYNPLSSEEDIFLGTKEKSKSDVKVLQGDTNLSNIKDVYYFQNKLFSATKVPKSYLGLEGDVNSKGTVTEQEIQFARTVKRIQNAIIYGVTDMCLYELALNGIPSEQAEFTVSLPTISTIEELRKWQSLLVKVQVAKEYKELLSVDEEFIMRHYLNMSESDIQEALKHRDEMADIMKATAKAGLEQAKQPSSVLSTGGAGNKAAKAEPTDVKHNQKNSITRATQKTAGTRPPSQQTNMNKNKSAQEGVEALQTLLTNKLDDPDELLQVFEQYLTIKQE